MDSIYEFRKLPHIEMKNFAQATVARQLDKECKIHQCSVLAIGRKAHKVRTNKHVIRSDDILTKKTP